MVTEKIQNYCGAKHFIQCVSEIDHKFNVAGDLVVDQDWKLTVFSCIETMASSKQINLSDVKGKKNCRLLRGWPRMDHHEWRGIETDLQR